LGLLSADFFLPASARSETKMAAYCTVKKKICPCGLTSHLIKITKILQFFLVLMQQKFDLVILPLTVLLQSKSSFFFSVFLPTRSVAFSLRQKTV